MQCYKNGFIILAFLNYIMQFLDGLVMSNPIPNKLNTSDIYIINMRNGNKLRSNSLLILQESKLLNILGYKPNDNYILNDTGTRERLNYLNNNTNTNPTPLRKKYNAEVGSPVIPKTFKSYTKSNYSITLYNTSLSSLNTPLYCEWVMKTINLSQDLKANHSKISYSVKVPICQPYIYRFESSKYSFLSIMGMTLGVSLVLISFGSALICYHHYRHKMIYGKLVRQSFDELTTPGNGVRRSQIQIKPRSPSSYEEISLDNDNFLNSLESASFPHYYTGAAPLPLVHVSKGTKF